MLHWKSSSFSVASHFLHSIDVVMSLKFQYFSELLSSDLALFTTVDFLNVVSNIMTEENWGYG